MADGKLCVGVDVGGTNTDAAILHGSDVVAWQKVVTTADVTSGVILAVSKAFAKLPEEYHNKPVLHVSIGTTHFMNATVQRSNKLAPVAVVRLCGPATRSLPPFIDFPEEFSALLKAEAYMVNGGYQYDTSVVTEIDEQEVKTVARDIKSKGINNAVVSGMFSSLKSDQEETVAKWLQEEVPELSVTRSYKVGNIGILERENASVLNESLKPFCKETVDSFKTAFEKLGLDCPFYLTQNDGTLISAQDALELPVITFASGATNSMRGAAFLSGLKDAIVVDIGGTTTDVGMLLKGFPREASTRVKVGGVNTNFRMPDVLSIGLGGGSLVVPNEDGNINVGPLSVGYKLDVESRVFGGQTLTATDVAVAGGLVGSVGDRDKVSQLSGDLVDKAVLEIRKLLEDAIDQVKISKEDQAVILVGGGGIIFDISQHLKGTSHVVKPPFFEVANAVGAALGQISGVVDTITSTTNRVESINEVKSRAIAAAVKAGADPDTVEIVDVRDTPMTYIPGNVTRITVKAVGNIIQPKSSKNPTVYSLKGANKKVLRMEDTMPWEPLVVAAELGLPVVDADGMGRAFPEWHMFSPHIYGHPCSPAVLVDEKDNKILATDIETPLKMEKFLRACVILMGCQGGVCLNPLKLEDILDKCVLYSLSKLWTLGNTVIRARKLKSCIKSTAVDHLKAKVLIEGKVVQSSTGKDEFSFAGDNNVVPSAPTESPTVAEGDANTVDEESFKSGPIDPVTGEWFLNEYDIDCISIGAGIMGCGGGGNPYLGRLRALKALKDGKKIRVLHPARLGRNSDVQQVAIPVAFMGSPLALTENVVCGTEIMQGLKLLMRHINQDKKAEVGALFCCEIGGLNSMEPLVIGAELDLPVLDADGMGRAFPELQMYIPHIYGHPCTPATLVDALGNKILAENIQSAKKLETFFRKCVMEMGCSGGLCFTPIKKEDIFEKTVLYSMSQVWRLGDAVNRARRLKLSPRDTVKNFLKCEIIMEGKTVDVEKRNTEGYTFGKIEVEGLNDFQGTTMFLEFQNEFLIAKRKSDGHVFATVPDMITALDSDKGQPLPVEEIRYGQRIFILVMACSPMLRTERALKFVGPKAFNYDVEYRPMDECPEFLPIPPP